MTRVGVRPVLAVGPTLVGASLAYYTQISVDGSYFSDLFPGFLMTGVGLGFSFVPISIAALSGVTDREAGLASGLINTSQQIGGAVGLAILSSVATTRTNNLLATGTAPPVALTEGFRLAFMVGVGFAIVGVWRRSSCSGARTCGSGPRRPSSRPPRRRSRPEVPARRGMFFGVPLMLAPGRVFSPRPATELLVRTALESIGDGPKQVADVGTGSGAIAVALAVCKPDIDVWATDSSPAAVELARRNAEENGVGDRVHVRRANLLESIPVQLDVVVANLPYLPASLHDSRTTPTPTGRSMPRATASVRCAACSTNVATGCSPARTAWC